MTARGENCGELEQTGTEFETKLLSGNRPPGKLVFLKRYWGGKTFCSRSGASDRRENLQNNSSETELVKTVSPFSKTWPSKRSSCPMVKPRKVRKTFLNSTIEVFILIIIIVYFGSYLSFIWLLFGSISRQQNGLFGLAEQHFQREICDLFLFLKKWKNKEMQIYQFRIQNS